MRAMTPATKRKNKMKNHPTYTALKSGNSYADVTDAAKLARTALKKAFPKTKFAVKSSKYAGGSSLNVNWTDGPTVALVEAVINPLSGKGFDGSIDMAYYKSTFVLPDGSFYSAGSQGTTDSGGYASSFDNEKPADAIEVSFGCYIFATRDYSVETNERTLKHYAIKHNNPVSDAIKSGSIFVKLSAYGGSYFEGTTNLLEGFDARTELQKHRSSRMVAA